MKKSVLSDLVLAALILRVAMPSAAATHMAIYHCDANFNQSVGAQFQVWWPCETDWTSWGVTSGFKEIIDNWDDCESGPQTRSCWIYSACCGGWYQVTCP